LAFHSPVLIQPAAGDPSLVTTGQEFRNYTSAFLSANLGMPFTSGNWGTTALGFGGVPDAGFLNSGPTGSLVVAQRGAGANFSVDVSSGWCYIIGTDVTGQGTYAVWNDATVNVTTPAAPGSGTRVHRLVVQLQDKFSLGSWTGYQAVPVLLPDVGSGTPNAGPSAITLALISIAAAQPSVQNANITDYRRNVGPCQCYKDTATGRGSTAISDDPDLQLWGLAHNATYLVLGAILYHGTAQSGGSDPGGLGFTFRTPAGASANGYSGQRVAMDGSQKGALTAGWSTSLSAQTLGVSTSMVMTITGSIKTGTTLPNNFLVFQWGQGNTSGANNTSVEANSWLRAERVE